jgi:hypothetical protein
MTTTATATKAPKVSKATKTPAARTAAAQEPSLRFYHSKALRKRTDTVLSALEAAPEKPQNADAVADLVAELVEAGMDYYFLVPLKQAEVGFLKEQSARLGMTGAVTLINSVSRKFIVRMDADQLLVFASHIRSLT